MATTISNIGVIAPNSNQPIGRRSTSTLTTLGSLVTHLLPLWYMIRTLALTVLAGVAFIVAAWGTDWRLGLAVAGAWLLVLEHLTTNPTEGSQ